MKKSLAKTRAARRLCAGQSERELCEFILHHVPRVTGPATACVAISEWFAKGRKGPEMSNRCQSCEDLRRQLVDVQAVVDGAVVSTDGVPLVAGREYWTYQHGAALPIKAGFPVYGIGIYSTRAAAESANKSKEGGHETRSE